MSAVRTLIAVAIAALLAAGCSSTRTYFDYDREADFSSLRTFSWIGTEAAPDSSEPISDLVSRRIQSAVERQLIAQGFEESSASPDFLVASHVGVKQRIEVNNWGYSYGRYGRYGGISTSSADVREYDEGTLILDIIEADGRKLIWRGTAKRAVSSNPSPEKSEELINSAVKQILAKFPPK